MGKDALTGSPFDNAVMPAPSPDEATTAASRGGFQMNEGQHGSGLVGTPFEKPAAGTSISQEETANMSELPKTITLTEVKEGPAGGSQIGVAPGVASPAVAVTPIVT